jgi:hypothetical protein
VALGEADRNMYLAKRQAKSAVAPASDHTD